MQYKMLVTDFDNTLLRTDHTILDKTWKAIKEFERRGGKFVICTGRMLSTILVTVKPFDLHGEIIAFQGGVVADLDTGDILLKKYVNPDDALSLLKDLEAAGYYIQIYSNGDYFVNRYTKRTQRYYEANAHLMPIVIGENVSEYVQKNNLKLDKIVFGLDDDGLVTYDEVQPVMTAFDKKYGGRLVFNSSNTLLIEAVSAGCTKGEAVEFVANRHGIAREEVICMGDALNDASMIEWAGLGVAVENATDDLKALADEITVSCDDDAVGYILNKYCL
ncbi:MAG: Cof-type HAD-IIB family hydrolase [Christensenellaceae bacterium]|nr:Cof-type HAD-IIB family hydrolase [Christensenellaceae bacterium]MDD6926638.1 Cof-type HAD-IIB family hydrolase [bacterium]MDY2851396.1 Cof-type HAD-IIB family hydrolase [Christensenellaceae bacterium]